MVGETLSNVIRNGLIICAPSRARNGYFYEDNRKKRNEKKTEKIYNPTQGRKKSEKGKINERPNFYITLVGPTIA